MSALAIQKLVYLEPKYLNSNYKNNIYEQLKKEMVGNCDQTYGYVLKVNKDSIKILENSVSNTEYGVYYNVKLEIETLKPTIGEYYKGTVCLIFPGGIFIKIIEKLKVLIPQDKLKDYTFDKSLNCFSNKKQTIKMNDTISVKILLVQYEKQNFSCIGSL